MAAYNHNTSKSCVFSQNLECVSQKMSPHAHLNFELSKDLAASILEPQPQNFGQAWIIYWQTNDVYVKFFYL
jgi:hypothetical protein